MRIIGESIKIEFEEAYEVVSSKTENGFLLTLESY